MNVSNHYFITLPIVFIVYLTVPHFHQCISLLSLTPDETENSLMYRLSDISTWNSQTLSLWFHRSDVVRCTSNVLTDMPASHLHLLRAVDVRQKSEAEPLTARRVSEAVDSQWRLWRMEWLTDATVQLIVCNAAPVWRLHVHHRLRRCWNWWRWHYWHQNMWLIVL